MNEYNSKFTGTEIDAALSRALPGGAIDTDLALKAPLASPALTGTPTINGVPAATLESPAFTGTPTINGVAAANVGQLCNPNLLDNWYFGNTVDQRGGYVVPPNTPYYSDTVLSTQVGTVSAYTKAVKVNDTYGTITVDSTTYYVAWSAAVRGYTGAGMTIDRWKIYSGVALIKPDGVDFTGQFAQETDYAYLSGNICTVSCLMSDGTLIKGTAVYPEYGEVTVLEMDGSLNCQFKYNADHNFHPSVLIWKNGGYDARFVSVKLELGSQQTIAHQENGVWVLNEIPDYGEQLARCQRYQLVLPNAEALWAVMGTGTAYSATAVQIAIPTPTTMRSYPVVTATGKWQLRGYTKYVNFDAEDANWFSAQLSSNSVTIEISGFNGTEANNVFVLMQQNDNTAKIILDANL